MNRLAKQVRRVVEDEYEIIVFENTNGFTITVNFFVLLGRSISPNTGHSKTIDLAVEEGHRIARHQLRKEKPAKAG